MEMVLQNWCTRVGLILSATVLVAALLKPILWPVIIKYPWKEEEKEDRVVVFAGSYNPPHRGHLAMLEYLSKRCAINQLIDSGTEVI
jgi:hypothetical protein